jgi:hypothetical protein
MIFRGTHMVTQDSKIADGAMPWNRTIPDPIDQSPQATVTHRVGSPRLGAVRARVNGVQKRGDYTVHSWVGATHIHYNEPDAGTTPQRAQEPRH